MRARLVAWSAVVIFLGASPAAAGEQTLDAQLHHLRLGTEREWDEFPQPAEGPRLQVRFRAARNATDAALRLRQQDVKQTWKVLLNGKELGRLAQDENDTLIYLRVPAGALAAGENTLLIESRDKGPDDIRVGEIALDDRPPKVVLSEATVDVTVADADRPGQPCPCRITVLDARGSLMTTGATSDGHLAVRPGVIYSGDGRAQFGLPAGEYTVYAGRGFAYSVASARVSLKPGDRVRRRLEIRREVPTPGYVSCDTHIHTLTYSGHGDATADERVLTLAGEDIALPVITEHNRHVDYTAAAVKHGVRRYFTPVVGNEVTTAVGHFNIFPIAVTAPVPDYRGKDWKPLAAGIARTGAKVVILNHPRDLHSGYRPFGPEHFNAVTGENLDGWDLPANAIELVNSGAMQTDVLRPYRDWFTLLNRGRFLTPVGASDSHDVSRYIVGQGRTYIRCKGDDAGAINVEEAVTSLREGRVLVSLGLLTEITVNDRYGPGDLVPVSGDVRVSVRVRGPGWVTASRVELYANGRKIREGRIADGTRPGVKWSGDWTLSRPKHDLHLVAVATGLGVRELYWPIGKPYQPTSIHAERHVLGSTGAVWLDADGDGQRTSAYAYARRLCEQAGGDVPKLLRRLADYDEAVAAQATGLLQARGVAVQEPAVREAAAKAAPHVAAGFEAFIAAWRECQIARQQRR